MDEGIAFLATPDIKSAKVDFINVNRITRQRYEESPEIALAAGDVLLTKDGATIGIVHLVKELPEPATVNGSVAVITPSSRWEPRFLYYVLASSFAQSLMALLQDGMGVPHLFQRDIRKIVLPCPPTPVQTSIAVFLDREIAQIDAMIEAQNDLLKLLEQRRASVRRRLFSALRENADMRPLKHLARRISGTGFPLDEQGQEGLDFEFFKVSALSTRDGLGHFQTGPDSVSAETARKLGAKVVPPNSSLMAKIGAASLLGRVGINERPCCIDNNMIAFTPRSGVEVRYLYHLLNDLDVFPVINHGTIPYLNERALMSTLVPWPNVNEQHALVSHADEELREMALIVSETRNVISLLKERREALITAAVTGRIDPHTGKESPQEAS
ncbi:restriction endonuclease subunit S [Kocuria sp. CH-021]|uniref:restriction endonuclease subunit S n=1 Tax=Kocuria sp. CH-021 TaxID=3406735 RepID=UPI003C7838A9